MALIRIALFKSDPSGVDIPANGQLWFAPSTRRHVEDPTDHIVLPAPFKVTLGEDFLDDDGTTVITPGVPGIAWAEVDPTDVPNWAWTVVERTNKGRGTTWVAVPNQAQVDYADLVTLDPDTLDPEAPLSPAWIADLAAHAADTTAVHGIANTANLLTTSTGAGGVLSGSYPSPGFAVDMATQAELDAAIAEQVTVADGKYGTKGYVRERASVVAPNIVTLISGQVSDGTPAMSLSTYSADTVNFKVGARGHKMTATGAGSASMIWDPLPFVPFPFPPAAAVCAWVYIEDITKVTNVTLDVYADNPVGSGHVLWQQTKSTGLVNGFNLLRFSATAGTLGTWNKAYRVRFLSAVNAATAITLCHMWLECPPKARVLFIADRGYKTLKDLGVPDLRALGIPITWALDPALNGTSVGTISEVITDADVATFAAAGDSISVHGWDGAVTSTMTADQIITDAMKSKQWCEQRGYTGAMWKAGWTQNDAPQAAAAKPLFLAYASPSSAAALTNWPPTDRYNIPRIALHSTSNATFDTYFAQLQKTRQLLVCYTHGIDVAGGNNITPASWAYFISKIAEGVAAGWLEGVTFESLFAASGGKFKQTFGNSQAEYFDETGTLVRRSMM